MYVCVWNPWSKGTRCGKTEKQVEGRAGKTKRAAKRIRWASEPHRKMLLLLLLLLPGKMRPSGAHMFYLSKTYEERYFNIGYVVLKLARCAGGLAGFGWSLVFFSTFFVFFFIIVPFPPLFYSMPVLVLAEFGFLQAHKVCAPESRQATVVREAHTRASRAARLIHHFPSNFTTAQHNALCLERRRERSFFLPPLRRNGTTMSQRIVCVPCLAQIWPRGNGANGLTPKPPYCSSNRSLCSQRHPSGWYFYKSICPVGASCRCKLQAATANLRWQVQQVCNFLCKAARKLYLVSPPQRGCSLSLFPAFR